MKRTLYGVLTLGLALMFLASCGGDAPETPETPAPDTTPATTEATSYPAPAENEAYPSGTENEETEAYPSGTENEAYPSGTEEEETEAYPSPEEGASSDGESAAAPTEPFVAPTPSSEEFGNVTGQLQRSTGGDTSEPFNPAVIYLGSILQSDDGADGLVELDKGIAPRADTDAGGNFAFTDVEPGRYGLMLDTPRGALLLKQPDGSGDLIVEVTGGEVLELGELAYEIEGF